MGIAGFVSFAENIWYRNLKGSQKFVADNTRAFERRGAELNLYERTILNEIVD